MGVRPGEIYRLELEVYFDEHRYGSTAGIPSGEIKIRRGDGKFWSGTIFDTPEVFVATTVAGGTTDPISYYDFTIPAGATDGEVFDFLMRVNSDPATEKRFSALVRTTASVGGGGVVIVVDED